MKATVNQDNTIQLEEVFNPIVLKTKDGEEMAICMRDSGFEFKYQGKWYFAKEGYVEPFHKSARGNYLVEQKHDGSVDCHVFYDIKENSQDLDTDIVDMVNEEFWNLI